MLIEYVTEGPFIYVKVDGVIGSKSSTSQLEAEKHADKIEKGLVQFRPLSITATKDLLKIIAYNRH